MYQIRRIFLSLVIMFALVPSVSAIELNATMHAEVVKNEETGIYRYEYSVENQAGSKYDVGSISIDHLKPKNAIDLPTDNLVATEVIGRPDMQMPYKAARLEYLNITAMTNKDPGVVPTGFTPPKGWLAGFNDDSTINWIANRMDDRSPFFIHPGERKGGFELTSYGLPGIRKAKLYAEIGDSRFKQMMREGKEEAYRKTPRNQMTHDQRLAIQRALIDQTAIHVTTIGPTAPPLNFIAIDFIDYLIDLRHQAEVNQWIVQASIIPDLDTPLNAVKASLTAGDNGTAITKISNFLNEVENRRVGGLTSEGYALLKFNALYLKNQLLALK